MRTTYTVRITGSGTAGQVAASLYDIARELHNLINGGDNDIEMIREDETLMCEITEE